MFNKSHSKTEKIVNISQFIFVVFRSICGINEDGLKLIKTNCAEKKDVISFFCLLFAMKMKTVMIIPF